MDQKLNLPLLPLRDIVVFPSMVIPLFVGRDKSITALNEVMKNDKKISICIPVYNGAKTIGNLVAEVIDKLKLYELEIILVNDGSKDDSENICIELQCIFA